MTPPKILIIEDESALAKALAATCQRIGASATLCASGERGLKELRAGSYALVILDIGLPDMSGLTVLENVNQSVARPPVLIITAHGTLDNAVSARQLGAAAYLVKPLDLQELEQTLQHLLSSHASGGSSAQAEVEDAAPSEESGALLGGMSPAMQRAFITIAHATATDAPALITGPTGVGKTLAARYIHANSRRRHGPFVTLVCGTLPDLLFESELFGHEKNSFTGAGGMRPGHLERAAGGTLFLDEIGDLPAGLQAKLLRFVEEKTFSRVGGREDLHVDLRLITATNRRLREEVQTGRFRDDLYYRLQVLEVELPALAARKEDIPTLCAMLLDRIAPKRELSLSSDTLALLFAYQWPGNVRELRNALERAAAVCSGNVIQPHHLPQTICPASQPSSAADAELDRAVQQWVATKVHAGATYKDLYGGLESTMLKHLLHHFGRKPTVLARVLKMNRATLLKKRRDLGLDP
jgi:DNA-binding NtrC family response regulator